MKKADKLPDWREVARLVMLSRALDRLEEEQLTPQGKVKYQFSSSGHELAQVLLAQALDHPHDGAAGYYRSRPFLLANGLTPAEALKAGMARQGSPSQGRDVGVVFNLPRRDRATVLPASGDVGAQYTPAAGWAQAIRYRVEALGQAEWDGALAIALGGEGSTAANGFWASLNIVATLRLPFLYFIEDNGYGLSVPGEVQNPGGDIAANLSGYKNLKVFESSGSDPDQAWQSITAAVRHVRQGRGPALLLMCVPRLSGHTFIDDQSYKSPELLAEEAERDPLPRLQKFWLSIGNSQDEWRQIQAEVDEQVESARLEAEAEAPPEPGEVLRYVYYEGIASVQGGLRPEGVQVQLGDLEPRTSGARINLVDAVRRTLETEMERNPRLLVFGEDVGVKGGVHGATRDMQAHFGEQRVFDTSLSEDGIIGRSVGMALAGLLPVPEIQFRKYADPAHEQINDLGTLRWRTANQFAAPLVVRIPVGFGKQTGDPWHSMTAEAVFAHLVGWRIGFPSNAADAVGLLRSALRGDDPTLFFEHRALLDTVAGRMPYPGDDYCLPFGQAARLSQGEELTVVSWGAMVARCQQAAQEFPGRVELIDLRTIQPWDQAMVLDSVRRTGKLLVVHEDTRTAGFASEIIATVASQAFSYLDGPPERLTMPDVPVPFNTGLMAAVMPGVEGIRQKMRELLAF